MTEAGPRHREEILSDNEVTTSVTHFGGADGLTVKSVETGFCQEYSAREMDDIVTPNFTKIQKTGGIVNNPMSSISSVITERPITFDCHQRFYLPSTGSTLSLDRFIGTRPVTDYAAGYPLLVPVAGETVASLSNKAITQAFADIGNDKMLGLATLAEANQSVQGLLWLLRKAAKIAKSVKKMQLKQLKREITWKELQEVYMNARYNLRPLAYDIEAIIDIIENGIEKPERQTFRGFATDVQSVTEETSQVVFNPWGLAFPIGIKKVSTRTTTARAGVLTQAGRNTMVQTMGLDKIVETAWDLTPYSFILDWFANVGQTISSWTPVAGFKTLTSWVVTNETTTQSVKCLGLGTYDSPFIRGTGLVEDLGSSISEADYFASTVTKTRIPNYQRPIFPSFDINLDPLKLLDLAIIGKNIGNNAAYVR